MTLHAHLFQAFRSGTRKISQRGRWFVAGAGVLLSAFCVMPAVAAVAIDSTPLSRQSSVPGNLVLVPSVEWPTVVTQANDPGVNEDAATYSTAAVTSCPSGYTLVGTSCQQSVPATPSCAEGFTPTGNSCLQTFPATASYSCPSGYSPSSGVNAGTTCSRNFTNRDAPDCPNNYDLSGRRNNWICSGSPNVSYSCSSGTRNGATCTVTGSAPTFSCPTGTASGSGSSMICITATTTSTTIVPSYAGYFSPSVCYAYHYDATEANRYFYPVIATGASFSCDGKTNTITLPGGGTREERLWSGNYLNWVSMQAIDTFRLALTGGYRVHRPADGTPPSVSVVGSNGTASNWATSEMPNVTYLEKANSDRWTNSYTKLRRLTANATDATPSQSAVSSSNWFRSRIGGLRNQMWFIPRSASAGNELGTAGNCCSATDFIPMDVPSGDQTDADGITAVPYNPVYHELPSSNTSTFLNGTACAADEPGCTPQSCPANTTPSGSTCSGTQSACPSTRPHYRSSNGTCYQTLSGGIYSGNTTSPSCPSGWTRSGGTCSYSQALQYQHTSYGQNQVYAVSVRVKVCDGTLDTRGLCTAYGANYKPEGLLQKNARKIRYSLFSYLSETGQQRQGGVMRARQKLIGPLSDAEIASTEKPYPDRARIAGIDNPEWDPATGVFLNNPDTADVTATNASIGNCGASAPDGSQCQIKYSGVINYLNRFGQILTGHPTLKAYDNLSELYYTALRYLRGLANISDFSNLTKLGSSDLSGTESLAKYQNSDGLPVIENWYNTGANAATAWNTSGPTSTADPMLYQCQTTVLLGIGDTSTNSEDDANDRTKDSGAPAATWRALTEFTGGAGRGNVAGLAYWAHLNDIRSDVPNNDVINKTAGAKRGQTLSTYWVDVVERNDLFAASSNQYYNATKYGGYSIPIEDWGADGNAAQRDGTWFNNTKSAWTSKTANVKAETGLGGTGDYLLPNNMYLANNGQKMIDGLNAAFQKISEDLVGSGASLAANSTKLDDGTTTYQAVYYNRDWRGDLKAFPVSLEGNINAATTWEASKVLPGHAARKILTCTGTCTGAGTAVEFKTTTTFDSKADLGASGVQDIMINYLRGSDDNELKKTNGTLRNRISPLGDIVNSQPVFVGAPSPNLHNGKSFATAYQAFVNNAAITARPKVIYVAANDGMLHGFNSSTGVELFAYLPRAVIKSGIKNISQTNYGESTNPHQFWNDGELVVADVECASTTCPNAVGGWASVLVGTTGRGPSKAVYALDVTNPADPELLWETSATASTHIGQVIGKPVIARMSDNSWVVLMGNGYNSDHGKPALLQFALSNGALSVYTTTGASSDGLAQPAVWISDDTLVDNISTEAYAGDLNGNVWEFALTPSGGSGTPVFTATRSDDTPQPITAGLIVTKNQDDDRVWVFFGTGAFLSSFKATDGLQTWYGLIVQGEDKVTCTGNCSTRSDLMQRQIMVETAITAGGKAGRGFSSPTEGDMEEKQGWYMDLKVSGGAETGERMVTPNQFQGQLLIGTSRLPTNDNPCSPSGGGWIMALNPFTGAPPTVAFFDFNNSGSFTDDTVTKDGVTYVVSGVGFGSIPNNPIFVSHTMLISFDDGTVGSMNTRPSGAGDAARLSWRELLVE